MTRFALILAMLPSFAVLAQAPNGPPAAGPGQPAAGGATAPAQAKPTVSPESAAQRLDAILDSWQLQNSSIESLYGKFLCKKKYNNLQGQLKYFDGTAKFLKLPGGTFGANITLNEFDAKGWKKDCYEKFVFTGGFLYMFDPVGKVMLVQAVPPPPPGQKPEDGPMPFSIFLLKKQDAKARFDLRVQAIDPHYTYIEIRPKYPADQQEFIFARIAVMNQQLQVNGKVPIPKDMIRELYWVEPNKAEVTWEMKLIEPNSPQVTRADVANPETPPGWKRENFQQRQAGNKPGTGGPVIGQPTNRVIRP